MGSLQDPIESFRAQSKERDANSGENIWDALGQYIARQLRNGKGVWVPKLGNFTFTGMNVDLAVSITITNFPHQLFYFLLLSRVQLILKKETLRTVSPSS